MQMLDSVSDLVMLRFNVCVILILELFDGHRYSDAVSIGNRFIATIHGIIDHASTLNLGQKIPLRNLIFHEFYIYPTELL